MIDTSRSDLSLPGRGSGCAGRGVETQSDLRGSGVAACWRASRRLAAYPAITGSHGIRGYGATGLASVDLVARASA